MFNLHHLKFFYDSVKLGSLTAAAQKNHLTRPGVSQAIMSLEEQLGVDLLEHKKREFKVTHQGKWLFAQCETLFKYVEDIEQQIAGRTNIASGQLRVGCSRSLAKFLLPETLSYLESNFPELKVSIKLGTTSEIQSALDDQQVDLGLILVATKPSTHMFTEIKRGFFTCVESTKNAFQNRFIITEERFETMALKKMNQVSNLKNATFLQIESWDLIFELVTKNLGVGLVPDFMLNSPGNKKIRVVPKLDRIAPYHALAIYRRQDVNVSAFLSVFDQDR